MTATYDKKATAHLAASLKTLSDPFLVCRDVRHAWVVENNFHVTPSQQEGGRVRITHIARDLACMRCNTWRHEHYVMTKHDGLEKVGQSYEYPEAYQIPGVPRGVKPSTIISQEVYRRALEEAAHAQPGERETAER